MGNAQTVQDMYAAFGRGDIPAILAHLADNVVWEYDKTDYGIPWLKPRQGRAQIAQFFEALAAVDLRKFQPKTLLESGNLVVALCELSASVKATGKDIGEEDEVHLWHFDANGMVERFCHKVDTLKQWRALQGA